MILVRNHNFITYENDIRALLQSFFPGEEIRCCGCGDEALIDVDAICLNVCRSAERFTDKSAVKLALYRYLQQLTGRDLPWGTLTGIRPVRIVEMMEARGLDGEAARSRIRELFAVSEEKLDLMFAIHEREQEVLAGLGGYRDGYSIYINIPFCPTRCLYCSFTSNPIELWETRVEEYMEAMRRELVQVRELCSKKLQTVYIGGGTPTALSAHELDKLLTMTEEVFGKEKTDEEHTGTLPRIGVREFTVESGRPDSITAEKLAVMKKHGVDRISINPQTMHQKTLDLIGRRHTVEQTIEAYELARNMGFDNINMDLIMGLPGEDLADVRQTLREIMRLRPDSLTVHALAVKRSSRLSTEGRAWGADGTGRKGQDAESGAEAGAMIRLGAETAAALGLEPYYLYRQKNMAGNQDNVGYALPGKESIYNILMMEEKHTVIGVGAGASTKLVNYAWSEEISDEETSAGTGLKKTVRRFENIKNIGDYLARIDELLDKKKAFLGGER